MPGIDFALLRQRVTMEQVQDLLGWSPAWWRWHRQKGRCPHKCSEALKACVISTRRQIWFCFRCHRGGNHLDFYAAATGQEVRAAALDLCARLGVDVPWLARQPRRPRAPRAQRRRHPQGGSGGLPPAP